MKYLSFIVISMIFIGCGNNKVYLVGELEDDYSKKPYIKEYKNIKNYPKNINKYSKEL